MPLRQFQQEWELGCTSLINGDFLVDQDILIRVDLALSARSRLDKPKQPHTTALTLTS